MNTDNNISVMTILLVDDQPRTLLTQKNRISSYLESKNFGLNWIEDEGKDKAKHVFEILRKHPVDIILLDHNISIDITGLEILKIVRERNDLTDILYYSATKDHKERFEKASNFRFTVVVEGRELADPLEELIDKNLMKWENIVFLRGLVISKMIELELSINEFFTTYFSIPSTHLENFNNLIMESGQNSLEVKRRGIISILKKEKLETEYSGFSTSLSKLQQNRNLLAHGKLKPDCKNILTVNFFGKDHSFEKKDMDKILVCITKIQEEIFSLTDEIKKRIRSAAQI